MLWPFRLTNLLILSCFYNQKEASLTTAKTISIMARLQFNFRLFQSFFSSSLGFAMTPRVDRSSFSFFPPFFLWREVFNLRFNFASAAKLMHCSQIRFTNNKLLLRRLYFFPFFANCFYVLFLYSSKWRFFLFIYWSLYLSFAVLVPSDVAFTVSFTFKFAYFRAC